MIEDADRSVTRTKAIGQQPAAQLDRWVPLPREEHHIFDRVGRLVPAQADMPLQPKRTIELVAPSESAKSRR